MKSVVCAAKNLHISQIIADSKNKAKITWQLIKKEVDRGREEHANMQIKLNNTLIDDPEIISKAFNDHFTSLPAIITKNLKSNNSFYDKLREKKIINTNSFFLEPVLPNEIIDIIKALHNTNAVGTDDIPVKILKIACNFLAEPIADIINSCFEHGYFPEHFKTAKVFPLHKKCEKTDISNYRPIAILPSISKIFETAIKNRIIKYLVNNNHFTNTQHGFRSGKSTTTALQNILGKIFLHINNNEFIANINTDLSKAFDVVDHNILLSKLEYYGIRGNALELLKSYLSNRQQVVEIQYKDSENEIKFFKSTINKVNLGVPQGSILGPLLYCILTNDLPNSISGDVTMYADDTYICLHDPSVNRLKQMVEITLTRLVDWFNANKLIINVDKTNIILFGATNSIPTGLSFLYDNSLILHPVEQCHVLGITVDNNLNWCAHFENLTKKLNTALYALKRIRIICNDSSLRSVYFGYFHSHLQYCVLFWGNSNKLETVLKIQKKALRVLGRLRPRDSCREIFKELRIMTAINVFLYASINFVFQHKDLFNLNSNVHSYNTRRNDVRPAFPYNHHYHKSFLYTFYTFYTTPLFSIIKYLII